MKTVQYWRENRQIVECDRAESLETDPHHGVTRPLTKEQRPLRGAGTVSPINGVGITGRHTQKNESTHRPYSSQKSTQNGP